MPTFIINKLFFLLLFFLLLFAPSLPSVALSFSLSSYRTPLSLSHSLAAPISNLRDSCGDFAGWARARTIGRKIKSVQGLGFWKFTWILDWDYLKNHAWRDVNVATFTTLASAVSDVDELLRALNDLSRVDSDAERVAGVGRDYNRVFFVSRSLLDKLLKIFRQSGPLREFDETMQKEVVEGFLWGLALRPLWEFVETMQKEVVEGDLLRDCLELGANDLKGLIQILKDIALQYTASTSNRTEL